MPLEENEAIVRKAIGALNKQDLSALDDFFSPNYVVHTYHMQGLEEFKQYNAGLYRGFPDWHEMIKDIIAEGNKVWVRLIFSGTHTGEYRGFAPNGKRHSIVGVNIYRVEDGKIVEAWIVEDTFDSLKQLGIIEITEKGKKLFPESDT